MVNKSLHLFQVMIVEGGVDVAQVGVSLLEVTQAEVAVVLSVERMDTFRESALMLANAEDQEVILILKIVSFI